MDYRTNYSLAWWLLTLAVMFDGSHKNICVTHQTFPLLALVYVRGGIVAAYSVLLKY